LRGLLRADDLDGVEADPPAEGDDRRAHPRGKEEGR
jgi:hypothetical protein